MAMKIRISSALKDKNGEPLNGEINLERDNIKVQPESAIEEASNNRTILHERVNEDLTINDQGFLDLSQISALQDVQPNEPGDYIIDTEKVEFTQEDKETLQSIIRKLASVCHTHEKHDPESLGQSTIFSQDGSCTNFAECKYCTHNADGICGNCCINNGRW